MLASIPNLLTLLNLFFGCIALVCALTGRIEYVPYWIVAAAFADLLDGMVARLLRVSSPLGIQLNSLADMVTFGVVPGVTLFQLLHLAWGESATWSNTAPAFLVTLFSALRLAKFNIDTRQTEGFLGLPTPAATLLVTSLLFFQDSEPFASLIRNPWVLYGIAVLVSGLLVSELPMFSFKFKHFKWQGNEVRFLGMSIGMLLLGWLGGVGIAVSMLLYIVTAVVFWALSVKV